MCICICIFSMIRHCMHRCTQLHSSIDIGKCIIYTCIQTHQYTHTYTHTHIITHMPPTYLHTYIHTCINPRMHPSTHASMPPCLNVSIHPCIHPCIHACMHSSIHPAIWTHIPPWSIYCIFLPFLSWKANCTIQVSCESGASCILGLLLTRCSIWAF